MLKQLSTLFIIVIFAGVGTLMAQTSSKDKPETENTSEVTNDAAEQSANPKASNRRRSPEVFVPSEEISEDESVPFPVDI